MQRGFTLMEVMLSLVLVTGTGLALVKQQWIMQKRFNQLTVSSKALMYMDNEVEKALGGFTSALSQERFQATVESNSSSKVIILSYSTPTENGQKAHELKREMIVTL